MTAHIKVLTIDDLLEFIFCLQEISDTLATEWSNCPGSMERYELMMEICTNAYYQAQLRAWILLLTENKRSDILYTELDLV